MVDLLEQLAPAFLPIQPAFRTFILNVSKLREKLANEKRLKEKYRDEVASLKEQMSLMAATHNALALSNHQFLKRITDLECELHLLKK